MSWKAGFTIPRSHSDIGQGITRHFRAGPRPFAIAALIALSLLGLEALIVGGLQRLSLDSFVFAGVVSGLLVVSAAWTKVGITNDSLLFRPSFWVTRRLKFKNVSHSHVTRLGPKPMNLYVFEAGRLTATFTIRLFAFSAEDVDWLLRLPQLQITEGKV